MATSSAVVAALARLQAIFPRDVTGEMIALYEEALSDVPNDALVDAVRRAGTECTFFPVPAELRRLAGVRLPALNASKLIADIQALGQYNPHGWEYPRVAHVRDVLGNAAAEAYGLVGASRLYSENDTTRDIAERDFAEAASASVRADPRNALPAGRDRALTAGQGDSAVVALIAATSASLGRHALPDAVPEPR